MNATTATGIPSDRDAALANQAGQKLAGWGEGSDPVPTRFGVATGEPVDIPTSAVGCSRKYWTTWRTAMAWH